MVAETGAMWVDGAVSTCIRVRRFGAAGPGTTTRATIAGKVAAPATFPACVITWTTGANGFSGPAVTEGRDGVWRGTVRD